MPLGIKEVAELSIALDVICSSASMIGKLAISPEFNQGIFPTQYSLTLVDGVPPSSVLRIFPTLFPTKYLHASVIAA